MTDDNGPTAGGDGKVAERRSSSDSDAPIDPTLDTGRSRGAAPGVDSSTPPAGRRPPVDQDDTADINAQD